MSFVGCQGTDEALGHLQESNAAKAFVSGSCYAVAQGRPFQRLRKSPKQIAEGPDALVLCEVDLERSAEVPAVRADELGRRSQTSSRPDKTVMTRAWPGLMGN